MKVAYAGVPGAFSHEAALRFLPRHEPMQVPTFADVVAAVEAGDAERGILPLANNAAGDTGARALIEQAPVRIVEELEMPVAMHLLGLPDSRIEEVTSVASHPVALRQCARTLEELGLAAEPASNTALAASTLADRHRGVLGSESAATLYGLAILKRDVHDRPDNATTFAVIARAGQ